MTEPLDSQHARLEMNARLYRFDEHLERAADLYDRDPQAWAQLPVILQDRSGIYRDMRQQYRAAVRAGAIVDDRGPNTGGNAA